MLPGILYFLGVITMLGEDFERGLALAEQGVAAAERAGNKLAVMRLSRGLAVNYAIDGRFELARRAMRWVMDELEPTEHRTQLSDLYVSARWVRDNVLYLCDDLDEAFASVVETHAMALSAPNRTVQAGSAGTISQILFLRGEYAEALRWADECLEGNEAIGNVSGLTAPAALEHALAIAREMRLGHYLARAARLGAGGEEAAGQA